MKITAATFLPALLGAVAGSLFDPLVWGAMAGGVVVGLIPSRYRWLLALGLVVLVFAVRALVSRLNRQALGLPVDTGWPELAGLAGAVVALAAIGLGLLARRLLRR